jgi:acyl carrier protein
VMNYSQWFSAYTQCAPQQRIDFSSKLIFDMAVTTSIVPLTLGLTIVICGEEIKKDTHAYLQHLTLNQVNLIKITPSYFKILLIEVKNNELALPDLQMIVLGGEALYSVDCLAWLSLYPSNRLFNEYGPTEATVAVSQFTVCKKSISTLEQQVPIGTLGPQMTSHILDAHLNPVKNGEIGELYLGGLCLARGYLNRPDLTQKRFINHHQGRLYKTGDLCRTLPDGTLMYEGRIDDQIKIRGFRVEPGEIEQCFVSLPGIESAIILGREDRLNEKRLIAYYLLRDPENGPDETAIRHHLQQHLPEYMIPAAFVRLDAFPLTANGKLDHAVLPVPQYMTSQHFLLPKTELEQTLASIWSEELDIASIGLKDNFFELGGDSLIAARIVLKINNLLGINVTLHDFYACLTIESMIPFLNEKQSREDVTQQKAVLYRHHASIPLSDFQFMLWMADTFEPKLKTLNITARKRMHGDLNVERLTQAFEALIKKHEILLYQCSKLTPTQKRQTHYAFKLAEENLQHLSASESELVLTNAMNQLTFSYSWPKNSPMIVGKLFYLKGDVTELQIGLPHVVCDDISPDILFAELSQFYLNAAETNLKNIKTDEQYKNYIFKEQQHFHAYMGRDIQFWEDYLNDAKTFFFPAEQVVKDMEVAQYAYSTYQEIPEVALSRLQRFCARNRVSIHDGLCAALGLTLHHCCEMQINQKHPVVINLIKSTRNHDGYEHALGCFLRLEPIKLDLQEELTLAKMSETVRHAVMHTQPFQQCGGLVKLASMNTYDKHHQYKALAIRFFIFMYTTIFYTLKLNRQYLNLCAKLSSFERSKSSTQPIFWV